MKKTILVVDLDGTLYSINTFHYFLLFLVKYSVKHADMVLLFKIMLLAFKRLLKIISHAKLKYEVLKSIKNKSDLNYQKFVSSIRNKRRTIPAMNENFDAKYLVTAAPTCYASIIAQEEGFDQCLGTNFPDGEFDLVFENSKGNKKVNLQNLGVEKIDVLVTDHLDDLPLMTIASQSIIVDPSKKMEEELHFHQIDFVELKIEEY